MGHSGKFFSNYLQIATVYSLAYQYSLSTTCHKRGHVCIKGTLKEYLCFLHWITFFCASSEMQTTNKQKTTQQQQNPQNPMNGIFQHHFPSVSQTEFCHWEYFTSGGIRGIIYTGVLLRPAAALHVVVRCMIDRRVSQQALGNLTCCCRLSVLSLQGLWEPQIFPGALENYLVCWLR